MKKKDQGLMHYVFAMILLSWTVLALLVMAQLQRMERLKLYLEDCMTQAGLSALLIEPYTYGRSGELIFGQAQDVEAIYLEYFEDALGSAQNQEKLGIAGEIVLTELMIYEKTTSGILLYERQEDGGWQSVLYSAGESVCAPDGTEIVSSSVYAKIVVPVQVWSGVTVEIERQHCVDVVS
ncbi:MAG: hypothetical protein LUG61_04540 [Lachnospiraceae bacterium]|nr:hypothetical protein [Lachnospiraceae bacterium]